MIPFRARLALLGLFCLPHFAQAAAPFVPERPGNREPPPEGALFRLGSLRNGDTDLCGIVGFSQKTLLLSARGELRALSLDTLRVEKRLRMDGGDLPGDLVSVSPDGRWRTGLDGGPCVRELPGGAVVCRLGPVRQGSEEFAASGYNRFCFSPEGKLVAGWRAGTGRRNPFDSDPDFAVWDARSGRQAAVFPDLPVGQAGFGKDGKSLLVWRNRTILSLDVASGKKNFQIDLEGEPCAGGFRVSPSGELFGLLSWTNKQSRPQEILLWESASGKLLRRVGALGGDGRPRFIQRFAFLEGGRQVLLALPGALVLVSTATGKEVRRWEGDFNGATDLAVRPDGRFAALTQGQTLRLVDLASGKDLLERPGHRDTVRRVACSLDGRVLVTGGYDETLCLWDPQSGRELRRLGGGDFPACSPALSADGRVLASRGSDEVIDIWDTRTGERTAGLALGLAHDVALSPDGLALALRHSRAAFRLADVRSGKVFFSWKEGDRPVAAMSFTPTNRLLVCAGPEVLHADPSAGKFVRRGTPLPQPDLPRPARRGRWDADYGESFAAAVSISASGRRVAYAHRGGSLVVVDLERDKILFSRLGSFEGAELALSPDGRTLAWSSGEDGVIHLVEAATGLERQELRHRPGRCKALAFSPDGKVLYSGSDDTTVLAWDLTGRLLLKAEWGKPLGPRGLQDCWASLAADATSWRASRLLIGSPAEAVPFLCGRIRPPLAADGRQVTRWLADLDRDDFDSRQKATAGLLALGPRALGVCRKALEDSPSLEVTRRLEAVVSHQAGLWADAAETTRYQRALEVLELIATAESRRALEALAKEAPGSALAGEAEEALGRLGRLK